MDLNDFFRFNDFEVGWVVVLEPFHITNHVWTTLLKDLFVCYRAIMPNKLQNALYGQVPFASYGRQVGFVSSFESC